MSQTVQSSLSYNTHYLFPQIVLVDIYNQLLTGLPNFNFYLPGQPSTSQPESIKLKLTIDCSSLYLKPPDGSLLFKVITQISKYD